MRPDPLRELERRVAVDPANLTAIQQLANLSLRVGWTYRGKTLNVWQQAAQRQHDFRRADLRVLGARLIPQFIDLIEKNEGWNNPRGYATRQLSRMGVQARAAIPALVNALSKDFNCSSDLNIMRCLGFIGCEDELVDLSIALSRESNNPKLHFEALKTQVKIDPKRFVNDYQDLTGTLKGSSQTLSESTLLSDADFEELRASYHEAPYWGRRFQDLQSILRQGQDSHREWAVRELRQFFDSTPNPWMRHLMLNTLVPVAKVVTEILPQLVRFHCEAWSLEDPDVRRPRVERARDRILPLLKSAGAHAIDGILDYVDQAMEELHKASNNARRGDLERSVREAFRLLEAFDVHLVPAMVEGVVLARRGWNLRRMARQGLSRLAPEIVMEALVMALIIQAFTGSQKIRLYAIECLGLFETNEGLAGPAMALIIQEEQDGRARRQAIRTLGAMGTVARAAFNTLINGVRHGSGGHRMRMARVIVELDWVNRAVLQVFAQILRDLKESKSEKRQLCELIAEIGPKASALRGELEALSVNFNVSLRAAAEKALQAISSVETAEKA